MSVRLPDSRGSRSDGPAWAGAAFIVEAMLLLVFLAACMAVFLRLYGAASSAAHESERLSLAVAVAEDAAEGFSSDPAGKGRSWEQGGFLVTCDVTPEATPYGTLYRARISVADPDGGDVLYEVGTARYVSGGAS